MLSGVGPAIMPFVSSDTFPIALIMIITPTWLNIEVCHSAWHGEGERDVLGGQRRFVRAV